MPIITSPPKLPTQSQFHNLLIDNQRLQKQVSILSLQIQQKDRIITELKLQIDSTIVEDTKNKLKFLRMIQNQVDERVAEERKQYLVSQDVYSRDIEAIKAAADELRKQLDGEKQLVSIYLQKIEHLKKYIFTIVQQKDYVIRELTSIIKSINTNDGNMHHNTQKYNNKYEQPQQKSSYKNIIGNRSTAKEQMEQNKTRQKQQDRYKNRETKQKKSKVHIKRNI